MNSTGRISWKPWHPFSEVKWLQSSWYDVKSAENPELPPYILSWEGRFKHNMMIWNFPPFLQNTDVVAAFPWQMLSIPFHTYRPGRFPILPKPICRSQLNIWMVRCEDIVALGCSPSSDPSEGLRFYLGIPRNLHLPLFLLEHPTS